MENLVPKVVSKIIDAVLSTGAVEKDAVNKIVDEIAGSHLFKKRTIAMIKRQVNGILGNEAAITKATRLEEAMQGLSGNELKIAKKQLNALKSSARANERMALNAEKSLSAKPLSQIRPGIAKSARGGAAAFENKSILDKLLSAVKKPAIVNGAKLFPQGIEAAASEAAANVALPETGLLSGLFSLKPELASMVSKGRAIPDVIKSAPSFFSKLSERPAGQVVKDVSRQLITTDVPERGLVKAAASGVPEVIGKASPIKNVASSVVDDIAVKPIEEAIKKDPKKVLKLGGFFAKNKKKLAALGVGAAALYNWITGDSEPSAANAPFDTKIIFKDYKTIK